MKIISVVGLQRSGNHAVIDWLGSLFGSCRFMNNNDHNLFKDEGFIKILIQDGGEDCFIFSFEDSGIGDVSSTDITESVAPLHLKEFPEVEYYDFAILRDPYNLWASRFHGFQRRKSGAGSGPTADPSWEFFRRNWLAIAKRQQKRPESVILYNKWVKDEAYRRQICAMVGGEYSEASLEMIPKMAGGSSFDGIPRPTFDKIMRNWQKYFSFSWFARVLKRPGYYSRRLFQKPASGKTLKVDERWKAILGSEDAKPLFSDVEIERESRRIFPELTETILSKAGVDR